MKCEDFEATGVVAYVKPQNSKAVRNLKLMKCEDFEVTGVVAYVKPQSSKAVRNFILRSLRGGIRG